MQNVMDFLKLVLYFLETSAGDTQEEKNKIEFLS